MLNAFKDDTYDGIYTSQKRVGKYPSIVYLHSTNNDYELEFLGSPPD